MSRPVTSEYLTAQVLTASPQKLHLMLIDGAIRFGQQARSVWNDEKKRAQREEALMRCVKISGELLACIRSSNLPARKEFTAVYAWLFRTMTEAKVLGDLAKLNEALELLTVERETWQQICEKFGFDATSAAAPADNWPTPSASQQMSVEGLSLEA